MRILFLTHRLPYAPNKGDRIRAYHMLKVLASHADVELVSLVHDAAEASHVDDLRELARVHPARVSRVRNLVHGLGALPTQRPLTHVLLDSAAMSSVLDRIVRERRPDVVLTYCSSMARFALEPPLAGIPFVLDMMDVDSAKWASLAKSSGAPRRWIYRREASCLSAFEIEAVQRAAMTFVVNDKERAVLQRMVPEADIAVLPNGIDIDAFRPHEAPSPREHVVFCGVMSYAPNVEGALWLSTHVWPAVRRRRPQARLLLVGSDPVQEVRRLAETERGIDVTGTVPDVRPFLWDSAVGAAPLLTARGIQNKVLEALAAGLPVVVTPAVADGLPPQAAPGCSIGSTAEQFADAIVSLLERGADERRAIASRADLQALRWSSQLAPLMPALSRAVVPPTRTAAHDRPPTSR